MSQQVLDVVIRWVESFSPQYVYFGITIALLQGMFISIFPEEIVLIAVSILVGRGYLQFVPAMFAYCFGVLGSNLGIYTFGVLASRGVTRFQGGKKVMESPWFRALAPFFRSYAAFTVFLIRFIPMIRFSVYFSVGFWSLPLKKFILADWSAAVIQISSIYILARILGPLEAILAALSIGVFLCIGTYLFSKMALGESPSSMDKQSRLIETFYTRFGSIYNFLYGKLFFNEGRKVAIDLLEIKSSEKVLEVGVGTGLTLPMYPLDCTVVGIDLSETMLSQAKELIKKNHIKNAEVKIMNASHIKYPDNSFDKVLGNLFISATSYPVESLLEMKRVCKKGGIIVLMNHFKSENPLVATMEKTINPVTSWLGFNSALEMEPLLHDAKLRVYKKRKVNIFNMWTAVAMKNEK